MSEEIEYTVAVCNYNMVETVKESLTSILDQLDRSYEVIVLDDGSSDGSQEIIRNLEEEYDILRFIEGSNNNLAEARNQCARESSGEHIIFSLDCDNRYEAVIKDLTRLYEFILDKEGEKVVQFHGSTFSPRELFLETPYRSLGYGEDQDHWRRLISEEKLYWIENSKFWEEIGYQRSGLELIKNQIEYEVVNLRSGVKPLSYLLFKLKEEDKKIEDYAKILAFPFAYLLARRKGIYDLPPEVKEMGVAERFKKEEKHSINELLKRNPELENQISNEGKKILEK